MSNLVTGDDGAAQLQKWLLDVVFQVAHLPRSAGGVDAQQDAGFLHAAHRRVDSLKQLGIFGKLHDVFNPKLLKPLGLVVGNTEIADRILGGHAVAQLELFLGDLPSNHRHTGALQCLQVVAGIDSGAVQIKDHRFVFSVLHKFLLLLHNVS